MGTTYKALIIDDSELAAEYAAEALLAAGFEVVTRTSAIGTSAVILREKPHIVLVDCNMPGMTGPDFVASLRRHPKLRNTVVLLYSERSPAELEKAARACGADGFIPKSTEFIEIPAMVRKALSKLG